MLLFILSSCSLPPDGFNPSEPKWRCIDNEIICLDGAYEEVDGEYITCTWDCAIWDDEILKVQVTFDMECEEGRSQRSIFSIISYEDWCNPYDFEY